MKKVKVTIEIMVPNNTKFVAIDKDGSPYAYKIRPVCSRNSTVWDISEPSYSGKLEDQFSKREVLNWRDTLKKVK